MLTKVLCNDCSKAIFVDCDVQKSCPECGALLPVPILRTVFVSFAEEDFSAAMQLTEVLNDNGITHYFYPVDNTQRAETRVLTAITSAISEARIFILLISRNALRSSYVFNELHYAREKRKRIVPLILEAVELPEEWRFWMADAYRIDLTKSNIELTARDIVRRINQEQATSEIEPEFSLPLSSPPAQLQGVDKAATPYMGPRPFDRLSSNKYFGRELEANRLVDLIQDNQIVLFHAPSGAGKSSLLNARVCPLLRTKRCQVLPLEGARPIRIGGEIPDGPELDAIPNVFVYLTIYDLSGGRKTSPKERLAKYLGSIDRERDARGRVLIFDQFEELFTKHLSRFHDRLDFIAQIVEALNMDNTLRVVFAFRKEYLSEILAITESLKSIRISRFLLPPMSDKGAIEAITQPVAEFAQFEKGVAEEIVRQLHILSVKDDHGREKSQFVEYVELAHLQVVCLRLWESLNDGTTLIQHNHIVDQCTDGVNSGSFAQGALSKFYRETVEKVAEKTGFRADLIHLGCQKFISETGNRTMVPLRLGRVGIIPERVVKQLESAYLLRVEPRGKESQYELAHDLLVASVSEHRDREASATLFAADLLDRVVEKLRHGKEGSDAEFLENYFQPQQDVLRECVRLRDGDVISEHQAELLFRTSVACDDEMEEWAQRLEREENGNIRLRHVLHEALSADNTSVRCNALKLLAIMPVEELMERVADMSYSDQQGSVRYFASRFLAKVDRPRLYERPVQGLQKFEMRSFARTTLARILIAAETSELAVQFRECYRRLSRGDRIAVWLRALLLRFLSGVWEIALPTIIAVVLAMPFGAMLKWVFGAMDWGVNQHQRVAVAGLFQGIIASAAWAGPTALFIQCYVVLLGTKTTLTTFGGKLTTILAGIVGGVLGSAAVLFSVLGVFNNDSLFKMGWITSVYENNPPKVFDDAFFVTRFGWVDIIVGVGIGIGMALVYLSIGVTAQWQELSRVRRGKISRLIEIIELIRTISRIALPRLWLMITALAVAGFVAYLFPVVDPNNTTTKANPSALIEGIIGDTVTQAAGAFFAVIGMYVGILIVRYGVDFERRADT